MIRVYDYDGKVPVENKCSHCGIGTHSAAAYCDVCQSMLYAVMRLPFFANAHVEWLTENKY